MLGTHVRKQIERLREQPAQKGASKPVMVAGMLAPGIANLCWRRCGSLRVFARSFVTFRWLIKEVFVLRTSVAFAAMDAWEARSGMAWAAAYQALLGGGGLRGFGCLGGTIGSGW